MTVIASVPNELGVVHPGGWTGETVVLPGALGVKVAVVLEAEGATLTVRGTVPAKGLVLLSVTVNGTLPASACGVTGEFNPSVESCAVNIVREVGPPATLTMVGPRITKPAGAKVTVSVADP